MDRSFIVRSGEQVVLLRDLRAHRGLIFLAIGVSFMDLGHNAVYVNLLIAGHRPDCSSTSSSPQRGGEANVADRRGQPVSGC